LRISFGQALELGDNCDRFGAEKYVSQHETSFGFDTPWPLIQLSAALLMISWQPAGVTKVAFKRLIKLAVNELACRSQKNCCFRVCANDCMSFFADGFA
jgi:hypothetical protein